MVAIKDVEMPKGCLDCDFFEGENTYCDGDVLIPYGFFDGRENKRHPNCPLVEIKERKVGKWNILACDLYMCSKCYAKFTHKFNFCPTCGAEMKGER